MGPRYFSSDYLVDFELLLVRTYVQNLARLAQTLVTTRIGARHQEVVPNFCVIFNSAEKLTCSLVYGALSFRTVVRANTAITFMYFYVAGFPH